MEDETTPDVTSEGAKGKDMKSTVEKRPLAVLREVLNSPKTVRILVVILVIGSIFYFKDLLIIATVDGKPISRWAVVKELEKQGGAQAIDSMITEKLIESEAESKNISITDEEIQSEIVVIEEGVKEQGMTLNEALLAQGLDRESLEKNIRIQKTLVQLLGDKVKATEDEISQYIEKNKAMLPPGDDAALRKQVASQIENQKLGKEAAQFVEELKAKSTIRYYKKY